MAIFRKKLKKSVKRNTETRPAANIQNGTKTAVGETKSASGGTKQDQTGTKAPFGGTKPSRTTKTIRKKKPRKKPRKKPPTPPGDRVDRESNQILIRNAMVDLMAKQKGRKPSNREIAEATGLHEQTIKRHVKDLEWKPQKSIWRVFTDDMFAALVSAGQKGSVRAIQLWFEVVEGWVRKTKQDIKHIGLDIDDNIDPDDAKAAYLSKLNPK